MCIHGEGPQSLTDAIYGWLNYSSMHKKMKALLTAVPVYSGLEALARSISSMRLCADSGLRSIKGVSAKKVRVRAVAYIQRPIDAYVVSYVRVSFPFSLTVQTLLPKAQRKVQKAG